jgi:high-affinity iron transporter
MSISAALPTFVITLREGVEAALVVGIVLACLKKAQQTQLNSWVYAGAGAGIGASALVGLLFSWIIPVISNANPEYAPVIKPLMEGIFSAIAIVMLSWMLIWMTQQAKHLKVDIEGTLTDTLQHNQAAGWGVFSLIFIAVLREGFETVIFIAANFQQGLFPALGAVFGLIGAVLIGVMLFKWGVKFNIRRFFQVMGVLLLLIVAGLVVSALKHFDAAVAALASRNPVSESLCFYHEQFVRNPSCILGPRVWDTSQILPDNRFPGIILKALFGYRQNLFLVQAIAYIVFLVTIGSIYFRSLGWGQKMSATVQKPASSQQD